MIKCEMCESENEIEYEDVGIFLCKKCVLENFGYCESEKGIVFTNKEIND